MSETWRDTMYDAICARFKETHKVKFVYCSDSEEARDLCDVIFDALEVKPELQDVPWNTIGRAIKGRNFSVLSS